MVTTPRGRIDLLGIVLAASAVTVEYLSPLALGAIAMAVLVAVAATESIASRWSADP